MIDRIINSRRFYRLLECIPAILTWSFIILPFILSLYIPVTVTYFILIYGVYWVYNAIKFVILAFIGHEKLLSDSRQDWLSKLKEEYPNDWDKYYYCSLIPYASESINVLRPTVQSIVDNNYPNSQKILCLSSEKAIPKGKETAEILKEEFKDKFKEIYITEHELVAGEMKGKSSNQNHGGRFVYQKLIEQGMDPEKILITSNDSDVLNHPQYIPYLIYKFLSEGDMKHKRIYQPVPTDYTGLWDATFFSRMIITIGVQWRLALQMRDNYRCTVYAFYSMSMKTLKEIDFWDVDLIPEDERTMFNALFTYGKDFKVVPLFLPTSGNPVQGSTFIKAFQEQYKQIRRWAWGASEIAYSFREALRRKDVSWRYKVMPIFNQFRNSLEWTLSSILPLFGGLMPTLLNEQFRSTTLAYTLPSLLFVLMQLASVMMVVIIYIEHKLAPKRPEGRGFVYYISTYLQWFLLPYVGFTLSAIPALDAQTRLLLNKPIMYVESRKEK